MDQKEAAIRRGDIHIYTEARDVLSLNSTIVHLNISSENPQFFTLPLSYREHLTQAFHCHVQFSIETMEKKEYQCAVKRIDFPALLLSEQLEIRQLYPFSYGSRLFSCRY